MFVLAAVCAAEPAKAKTRNGGQSAKTVKNVERKANKMQPNQTKIIGCSVSADCQVQAAKFEDGFAVVVYWDHDCGEMHAHRFNELQPAVNLGQRVIAALDAGKTLDPAHWSPLPSYMLTDPDQDKERYLENQGSYSEEEDARDRAMAFVASL